MVGFWWLRLIIIIESRPIRLLVHQCAHILHEIVSPVSLKHFISWYLVENILVMNNYFFFFFILIITDWLLIFLIFILKDICNIIDTRHWLTDILDTLWLSPILFNFFKFIMLLSWRLFVDLLFWELYSGCIWAWVLRHHIILNRGSAWFQKLSWVHILHTFTRPVRIFRFWLRSICICLIKIYCLLILSLTATWQRLLTVSHL